MLSRRALSLSALAAVATPTALSAAEPVALTALYVEGEGPTDVARRLEGRRVRVTGFMAPPLRAQSRFFVLTETPMAVCPFCDEESDWGSYLIAVYVRRMTRVTPFYEQIAVEGELKIGAYRDPDTDFLSLVRIEGGDVV